MLDYYRLKHASGTGWRRFIAFTAFYLSGSSLKHQGKVTRRRLFQQWSSPGLGSTSAVKGTSTGAKIGLFYYYCFSMALYGGQMSWLAAFCPGSFYPVIIFWCEIHFTPYESTGREDKCSKTCAFVWCQGAKDQERPLVPKMWSNSVRMSSTAWFW